MKKIWNFTGKVEQRTDINPFCKFFAEMEFFFIFSGDSTHKIFTHILYDSYVAPSGFQYEMNIYSSDNINVRNFRNIVSKLKF